MKIARVTGTVTATVKDGQLLGVPLIIADVEDAAGKLLEKSIVAADTCAAGPGDRVLLTLGSAARLPASVAGMPVDATVVAIIDHIELAAPRSTSAGARRSSASKRNI